MVEGLSEMIKGGETTEGVIQTNSRREEGRREDYMNYVLAIIDFIVYREVGVCGLHELLQTMHI